MDPQIYSYGPPPQSQDEAELNQILRAVKKDLLGAEQLGLDGVIRSFTADRDIIDAVGLSPKHIQIWFERMPVEMRKLFQEDKYRDAEGRWVVDGTKVPAEKMYGYDKRLLPPPMPKEEQEKRRRSIEEQGLVKKLQDHNVQLY